MSLGTGDGLMPSSSLHESERNAWWFELPHARPTQGLNANDTGSKWYRIKATKALREETYWKTVALKIPPLERIRIDVAWYVNTKRNRDASNLGLFTKPIYDAICSSKGVSAHVVTDDTSDFCETPTPTIHYDRECTPHFTVTITRLGSSDS